MKQTLISTSFFTPALLCSKASSKTSSQSSFRISSRTFSVLLFIMVFLITVIQPVMAEKKSGKKRWGRASPVEVTVAKEDYLAPTIQVPGTIMSRQQSDLPAEVSGKLLWVAEVGQKLKQGEPVAKLDDSLYRLQVSENKASLLREKTRLKYLNKELKQLEELMKNDFSSRRDIDKALLDRDIAQAEINVAEARVKVDEETLSRYLVKTPFDGIVVKRVKKEGEWVGSGATLVTFSNPDNLEIVARVSEKTILHLKKGDAVSVIADGKSSIGKVRAIVRVGDINSHLFEIRINLSVGNWIAGKTVRVNVPIGESRMVMSVPRDALVLRRSGVSLYRINDENKSEKISVTTGITGGDRIEILGPINVGDKIVIRGNERLREGQSVRITNENPSHSNQKPSQHSLMQPHLNTHNKPNIQSEQTS